MAAMTSLLMGGLALGSSFMQSEAAKSQGEMQQSSFKMNERLANMQADDSIRRGENDVAQLKTQTRKMIGSQRAAMAAQGIEIDSGSAAEIQADTAAMSANDAQTIRNNAWKEAWGFKVNANNSGSQAQLAKMSSSNASRNALLTGGMQAINYGSQAYGNRKS